MYEDINKALLSNQLGVLGLFIIIGIFIVAIFAPQIAPYSPTKLESKQRLQPPSLEHPFGTDTSGRDIFSRVIYGSRISLMESVVVLLFAVVIGMLIGSIGGYFGGLLDELVMRITDIFMSFPPLILALVVNSALGPGLGSAILAVSITWWPAYARMIRGQVMTVKNNAYVEAAGAIGNNSFEILKKHILPNCMSPIIVQVTLDAGSVLVTIAGLSFIGLGAQPPTPEWGAMVNRGRNYILTSWWWPTFPGLAICILVVSFNVVGDVLRDVLDPQMQNTRGGV